MKFLKRPVLKSARYYAGRVRGTARECANRLGAGIWVRLMPRACQSRPPGREACPLCMRVAICAKSILRHLALWAAPRIAPRQRNQWAVAGQGYSNRIQKVVGARGGWGVHTPSAGQMSRLLPDCLMPSFNENIAEPQQVHHGTLPGSGVKKKTSVGLKSRIFKGLQRHGT